MADYEPIPCAELIVHNEHLWQHPVHGTVECLGVSLSLLDDDGLCRLSGFEPDQCGCDKHRGALLNGDDEAIIEALVRPELFGGSSAVNGGWLAHTHDDELKDDGRLG